MTIIHNEAEQGSSPGLDKIPKVGGAGKRKQGQMRRQGS